MLVSSNCANLFAQKRVLYVFDPVALQSIILKDQQYYEESSFTISYASHYSPFCTLIYRLSA